MEIGPFLQGRAFETRLMGASPPSFRRSSPSATLAGLI